MIIELIHLQTKEKQNKTQQLKNFFQFAMNVKNGS